MTRAFAGFLARRPASTLALTDELLGRAGHCEHRFRSPTPTHPMIGHLWREHT